MGNKNARVIILLAVVVWLGGILAFGVGAPAFVRVAYVVIVAAAIPLAVLYLLTDTGWRRLAARHRVNVPFTGIWLACPTGGMAPVSVGDEAYNRTKATFRSVLRVGVTDDSLYLSTLFSGLPGGGVFFPVLQVPWSDVRSARTYEAPGWVASRAGVTGVSATYDPNYTGTFVELVAGEPPVFIQLPASLLEGRLEQLPLR